MKILTINSFYFSDYKVEYEKLREEKLLESQKTAKERLEKIKEGKAVGTEVPMASFITEISSGRDLTDIYLKHPANESSEDEDGVEDEPVTFADDEKEEEQFNRFVSEHKAKLEKKIKMQNVREKQ